MLSLIACSDNSRFLARKRDGLAWWTVLLLLVCFLLSCVFFGCHPDDESWKSRVIAGRIPANGWYEYLASLRTYELCNHPSPIVIVPISLTGTWSLDFDRGEYFVHTSAGDKYGPLEPGIFLYEQPGCPLRKLSDSWDTTLIEDRRALEDMLRVALKRGTHRSESGPSVTIGTVQ